MPPFTNIDTGTHADSIYEEYQQNEAKANDRYKGKKVLLERAIHEPLEMKTDKIGNKYIPLILHDKIKGDREVIRCYLYRPEKPTIGPINGPIRDIFGICSGKIDGVIVFHDCYLKESSVGTW